jgi:alkylation response protein AidB-like acyl-CoA dehydrogenase
MSTEAVTAPSGIALPSSAEGLVERVRALAPMIAEHAARAERERKPVDAVIRALEETGVFRSFVPRRFGGYEIDVETFVDAGLAVAEACTSTGWVTTFYMEHNWMLAQFPQAAQEAIFGQQPYVLAPASITPNGQARREDGGYRLSGQWAWGTGVMHADWVILNGMVERDGEGEGGSEGGSEGGVPDVRLFIVPRDAIEVADTWYCDGMEGTGSNDMIARDLFVPEAFSESLFGMALGRGSGSAWLGSPTYRNPMLPLLAIAAAIPALGAARRARELFLDRLGARTLYATGTKQGQRPSAQIRLGTVSVQIDAAETLLRQAARDLQTWCHAEEVCPTEERARLRMVVAQAVHTCREAIGAIMEASGASAHLRSHPMQRLVRDVNTISCHTVFDREIVAENYGRLLLGMEPATPL